MSDATTLPPELEAMLHNLIASAKNAAMFGTDDDTQSLEESRIALRTALASLVADRERLDWLEANSRIHAEPEDAHIVVQHHEADPFLDNEDAGFYTIKYGPSYSDSDGDVSRNYEKTYHGDSLRAAIDAARASTPVVSVREAKE